ncbi:outer membrane beta-barrel protein [Synoicihabitans lomoniglobus]|uniref:Outer membrane beta-barrel protein n=1 Tax=Synoicihabitans lomoniglobus TaxID=2909285 RepID=A0AAF0CPQ0_9BACT|nr:outer membrane beta-barrel protein [Opitutaceae bacterium LMO-M01]WED65769.1 outer membrane beta-barrel protein [Opitutaceae bacterium LMO-M01]
MNKIKLITAAFGAIIAGSSVHAAPFMAVGSSAELFVTAKATLEFNDNLTLGSDYVAPGATQPANPVRDDTVVRFAPGLSFEFGKNALVSGKFAYVETITRHSDNDDLDSELSDVSFNIQHKDEKSTTSAKASYRQMNQNTVDLRSPTLSGREVFNAGVNHEMEVTAKTSLGFGFNHTNTSYKKATFIDQLSTSIPVSAFYELTPKVDLSFNAQYREVDTDRAASNSDDWTYTVGARGDFTPKLSGSFKVGVVDRSIQAGGGRTSLALSSNFSYAYSPKTSFTFSAGNDFNTTGTGNAQENLDFAVGVSSKVSPDLTISSRVSVRELDNFTKPSDTFYAGSLSAEYVVNAYWQLRGAFNYQENQGGTAGSDFDNKVFSFSALLRY